MNRSDIETLCREHGYLDQYTNHSHGWWHLRPDPERHDHTRVSVLLNLLRLADIECHPNRTHAVATGLYIRKP